MIDVAKAAGVTRQTVYDHFSNRSEMLTAAILHFGDQMDVDSLLADSRAAETGEARLAAFTRAMTVVFPLINPLHKALTRLGEADADAKAAWDNRLAAMKEGCAAAIAALARDGRLRPEWSEATASDYYFTLLRDRRLGALRSDCGWREDAYLAHLQRVTHETFVTPA
ncbi:MAG: TetR/AcrR family transcriptional regulator [Paracoccaceae bacterium]